MEISDPFGGGEIELAVRRSVGTQSRRNRLCSTLAHQWREIAHQEHGTRAREPLCVHIPTTLSGDPGGGGPEQRRNLFDHIEVRHLARDDRKSRLRRYRLEERSLGL
jgi:hypothetical protein